jgi:Zn-dependent peptidase ImmA (M78 family)
MFWIFSNFVGMINKLMTDTDYMECFVKQVIDERWIKSIENCVAPWVEAKGKSYWDVVRIASIQNGTLNDMSRREFAELIFHLCPEVFGSNETAKKIASAMEKCPHTSNKKKEEYDLLSENHILKKLVREVEGLLEQETNKIIGSKELLANSLYSFLEKMVKENSNQKIFRHKEYKPGIRPDISIEFYLTQRFKDQENYSFVVVFELFERKITPKDINDLYGRYSIMKNTKIDIITTEPISHESRIQIERFEFAFTIIKVGEIITDKNLVLPRSVGDIVRQQLDLQIIDGHRPMDTPLLIYDSSRCTSSLSEWLIWNNIEVSSEFSITIPYIKDEEIEELANINSGIHTIEDAKFKFDSGNVAVDVFSIAKNLSISYEWGELPDDQLGRIDLVNHHVILDVSLLWKEHRRRFTMSHEIGHYVLHSNLPEKVGRIESFGDDNILFDSSSALKNALERCEIQANKFAASLLMPRYLIAYLYAYYYGENISRPYGDSIDTLYWDDNNPDAIKNCKRVIQPIANSLQVSESAVKWRLKNMNILKEGLSNPYPSRKKRSFLELNF